MRLVALATALALAACSDGLEFEYDGLGTPCGDAFTWCSQEEVCTDFETDDGEHIAGSLGCYPACHDGCVCCGWFYSTGDDRCIEDDEMCLALGLVE
jgi:hypothetical protein